MRKSTMKCLLVLLFVSFLASAAYATQQEPEKLIYKGQEYRLACVPLEKYFDANDPRPKEFRQGRTSLHRGYVGTWHIKDEKLYLRSLARHGRNRSMQEIPISVVFKDQKPPIKATWYTGVLRCPQGDVLRTDRLIYSRGERRHPSINADLYISASRGGALYFYEEDIYFGVVRGNIISEHHVDNKGKGATRSVRDWGWVASVSGPIKDDFKWHDFRLVASDAFSPHKESAKSFRTRGVYATYEEGKKAMLWIPATPTTKPVMMGLASIPKNYEGKAKGHVEITAHFERERDGYSLHVDSIRPLKPGETMHHPDFKPPKKPPEKTR